MPDRRPEDAERGAVPSAEPDAIEAMLDVLRAAANNAPDRSLAVRYTQAHAALMGGPLRSRIPPYLLQCASLMKFREFITLFAPDAARRVQFIEASFEDCRTPSGVTRRRYDVFGEEG